MESLEADNAEYQDGIETLRQEVGLLKTKNARLEQSLSESQQGDCAMPQ